MTNTKENEPEWQYDNLVCNDNLLNDNLLRNEKSITK